MIEIRKTKPGEDDFHAFKNFRDKMYPPDILHSHPEEGIDGEILHSCYLLMKDNAVCARAAVYNNPYLLYNNKKAFCIGHYECVNDEAISSELFSYIFADIKQSGVDYVIGPMNGSTWNQYRFSLHHDFPDFFLEPYHHLYYNEQFVHAGFNVVANFFSGIETSFDSENPAITYLETQFRKAGVTFRNINLNQYEQELKNIYRLTSLVFKDNFLYTPLSEEKFIMKYVQSKEVIDPELVIIAEDEKQNIIGYFFCISDLLNSTVKSLIIKTVARHPDTKWKGLGHVIGNMIYRRAKKKNYTSFIHAFINEQGASASLSKHFYGDVYKRYALYGREV